MAGGSAASVRGRGQDVPRQHRGSGRRHLVRDQDRDRQGILAQREFTTWRSDVPIAKTIVLDEATFPGKLDDQGRRLAGRLDQVHGPEGFVLRNDRTGPLLELYKAKYVILEGLTLRGGLQEAVSIARCEHVRVVNCDIAGWGRIGMQRFDLDGKYYTEDGRRSTGIPRSSSARAPARWWNAATSTIRSAPPTRGTIPIRQGPRPSVSTSRARR